MVNIALHYVRKKFTVSASIQEAKSLNLSVYIVFQVESILLANAFQGKFTSNLCSHTMSFKVLGSSWCSIKLRGNSFLIFRVLVILENCGTENLRKKNWFASNFYFQKLSEDINWLRLHLKLTTRELKPLLGAIKWDSN